MSNLKKCIKEIFPAFILSLSGSFMVCFYAPYELYVTNQFEFWFDMEILLPVLIISFSLVTIGGTILSLIIKKVNEKIYCIGLVMGFIAFIALYFQGTFFCKNLPALDGTSYDWNAFSFERIKSIMIWLIIVVFVLIIIYKFKFEKIKKIITGVCGFIFLMYVCTVVLLTLTTKIYDKQEYLKGYDIKLHEVSENQNFIILVVDALDSNVFEEVLDANLHNKEIFEDFTYFNDALSAYTFTKMSIPFILTGEWNENQDYYGNYVSDAIDKSALINSLEEQGYKMGVYTSEELSIKRIGHEGQFENIMYVPEKIDSPINGFRLMLKMAGIKFAPWDLKRFSYDIVDFANSIRYLENEQGYSAFTGENSIFYNDIKKSNPITTIDDKYFKFIHIEGAHVPYRYDKEVNIVENGTYKMNVEACFTIVEQYLNRLKEAGVYDNSVIVIMSDHGYNSIEGRDNLLGRLHSAVLVKGINEKHPMEESAVPVAYHDMQEAFLKLLEGRKSNELFDYKETDVRKRRCIVYKYMEEGTMTEYFTYGKADDLGAFQASGTVYVLQDKE